MIVKDDDRLRKIRDEERKYHEALYANQKLFSEGSWLAKPVRTVTDFLNYFESYACVHALDLGCGVGRNSIPIAEALRSRSGKVVCVDLLASALARLTEYSREYGVSQYIETVQSDIGDYPIADDEYDYIVAVSSLEHVDSERTLASVLERMARGTRHRGVNCIIMNADIQEIDRLTGAELEPYMELNLSEDRLRSVVSSAYSGWKLEYTTTKALEFEIERDGREILLRSDCVTFVWRNTSLVNQSLVGKEELNAQERELPS